MPSQKNSFSAEIYQIGINRCVDVPAEISERLGGDKHLPVVVEIRGHTARTTLMPAGAAHHRVFLTGSLRRGAGVDTGDRIDLTVERDPDAWDRPMPHELAEAFDLDDAASRTFSALTPAQQREIVRFVDRAKRAETREARVVRVLEILADRAFEADHA